MAPWRQFSSQFSPRFGWHRPTGDPEKPELFKRGAPKQASTAMFHLVNFLSARLLHDPARPPYLHGWLVALPDAEIQQSTLPPEAQGHVLDAKHCRDPQRLAADIEAQAEAAGADEVMVTTTVWSHEHRLRSYRLLAESFGL